MHSQTINCTFEEFKRFSKEFHDNAPSMNQEELDNAFKALGLCYLGMFETEWKNSAVAVLRLSSSTYFNRSCELAIGDVLED